MSESKGLLDSVVLSVGSVNSEEGPDKLDHEAGAIELLDALAIVERPDIGTVHRPKIDEDQLVGFDSIPKALNVETAEDEDVDFA